MFYYVICRGMFNNVVHNSADDDELYDSFDEACAAAKSCIYDSEQTYFIYKEAIL